MEKNMITIKAAGDWELDVLGLPYGDPDNRDSDGEWFDADTKTHDDKFGLPPAVYYHGYTEDGKPAGEPQYIGKTVRRWADQAGVWFRVVLDKANEAAKQVWDAAQEGIARASSGSIAHLARVDQTGHIREWPVAELSIFDAVGTRQPANRYAVALPVAKAVYKRAGMDWPDSDEPETVTPEAEQAAPVVQVTPPETNTKERTMPEKKEEQVDVAALVAEAMKAEMEKQAAAAKAKADEEAAFNARVDERVEAKTAELEEKLTKANRLPTVDTPMVNFINDRKYDHLDATEVALVIDTLKSAGNPVPEDAYKALGHRVLSEEGQATEAGRESYKSLCIKANKVIKNDEIQQSDLSNYGDDWVGVLYGTSLWEKIRAGTFVVDRLPKQEVPQGRESMVLNLESTDPTWYKVSQAADLPSTEATGWPNATITSSQMGTANQSLTLAKAGARMLYTGELDEDSLIAIAPEMRRKLIVSGAETLEHIVLNGDTTTSATTNINDIAGTPGGSESFMIANGMRKLALVTNTANSRSAAGSTVVDTDYLETVKLLGAAGLHAADPSKVTLIPDARTYWKSLELAAVKTEEVFPQATIVDGKLARIWGFEVVPSWFSQKDMSGTVVGAYSNLSDDAGKIDIDTTTNNLYGSILAVRWDQWLFGWKRRMTLETTRIARADTTEIVAMMRFGLVYRDTDAAAITYYVGV